MRICWYCHWGIASQVADIYTKYSAMCKGNGLSVLNYGPGHIVWDDENLETEHIQWCIDNANEYRGNLSDDDFKIAVDSLKELLTIPEEIRCCEPEDYDGENPDKYPPPEGLIMVRI